MRKSAYEYASNLKWGKVARDHSWSEWIKYTNLNPGMDAKDWYKIFDNAIASAPTRQRFNVNPTHRIYYRDNYFRDVEIISKNETVIHWRCDEGLAGSDLYKEPYVDKIEPLCQENQV
jgi:hypothetical protein